MEYVILRIIAWARLLFNTIGKLIRVWTTPKRDVMFEAQKNYPANQRHMLPCLWFDSEAYDAKDRLDAVNEFSEGLYHYDTASAFGGGTVPECGGLRLNLTAWRIGDLSAAKFQNSALIAASSKRAEHAVGDTLFLRVVLDGEVWAKSGDTELHQRPGALNVMQANNVLRPCCNGTTLSLRIPYDAIDYEPHKHRSLDSIPASHWAGRLLIDTFGSLFETLPTTQAKDAASIEATLTGLVRGLLTTTEIDDTSWAAIAEVRADVMKRYIRRNLKDEDLGIESVMQNFGASRSSTYRAFEEVGGVARYIRDQRLRAIYRELSTSEERRGIIKSVAQDYCFWDQSYFFRAFREVYGIRPGDIVGIDVQPGEHNQRTSRNDSRIGVPNLASFWSRSDVELAEVA
ncbi:MAG: AraC family transcriptional regulator [Pseudomonadota bacterium]